MKAQDRSHHANNQDTYSVSLGSWCSHSFTLIGQYVLTLYSVSPLHTGTIWLGPVWTIYPENLLCFRRACPNVVECCSFTHMDNFPYVYNTFRKCCVVGQYVLMLYSVSPLYTGTTICHVLTICPDNIKCFRTVKGEMFNHKMFTLRRRSNFTCRRKTIVSGNSGKVGGRTYNWS